MTELDRLSKLAESFYRQARSTSNGLKRRALMQRGDRLLKKAQDLRRENIDTTQDVYPESDLDI